MSNNLDSLTRGVWWLAGTASNAAFSFLWFGQYFGLHMANNVFLCEVNEVLLDVFSSSGSPIWRCFYSCIFFTGYWPLGLKLVCSENRCNMNENHLMCVYLHRGNKKEFILSDLGCRVTENHRWTQLCVYEVVSSGSKLLKHSNMQCWSCAKCCYW